MQFATSAIHVWQQPDPHTGAIIPPLYLSSTYVQAFPWVTKGYDYTRSWNPNFSHAEHTLASLEKGSYAHIYSSGLGAMTTIILSLLKSWDTVLTNHDVYGWTYRLLHQVFEKFWIGTSSIDFDDSSLLRRTLWESAIALIWVESPSNPLLKTIDLEQIISIAHAYRVMVVVDNTFATPYFQQPLSRWADIVVHSTTKYLNGHSDMIWWATITNNKTIADALSYTRNASGTNPNPFDAWLLSRSLKTLAIRMEQHQRNAQAITTFLLQHPLVTTVYYPWFGGMISVEFNLTLDSVKTLISSFQLFRLAESLWSVESLIDHPASMTHASIPASVREKHWLTDGLVRLSVGIEDPDDLLNDLRQWLHDFITKEKDLL